MSRRRHARLIGVALWTLVGAVFPAAAVEVTIDDFTEAVNTKIIAPTQVVEDTAGESTTATDTGLTGVIGGVRELTVTATTIGGASEKVVSGVDVGSGLCYQSTDQADGHVHLLYDRGGMGLLNADLHHAQGIEIDVLAADAAAAPYQVEIKLVDTANNSAASAQTSSDVCTPVPPPCSPLLFPFSDFPGVNPRHIASIAITIDPNGGNNLGDAADFFLGPIMTYGTPETELICDDGEDNDNDGLTDCKDPECEKFVACLNTAPLLSPTMMGALVALLSVVGFVGMARTRWGK